LPQAEAASSRGAKIGGKKWNEGHEDQAGRAFGSKERDEQLDQGKRREGGNGRKTGHRKKGGPRSL